MYDRLSWTDNVKCRCVILQYDWCIGVKYHYSFHWYRLLSGGSTVDSFFSDGGCDDIDVIPFRVG